MDDSVAVHIDRCLGCLACVPACPSGVRYDLLIERTRAKRRVEAPQSPRNRVIDVLASAVFTRPRLLRAAALPLAAGIRPMALAPRVSLGDLRARPPRYTPARGPQKQSAALLEGCVQSVFFGRVNAAAVKALAADGCECSVPAGQGCCGALALHSGRDAEARAPGPGDGRDVRGLRAGGGDRRRLRLGDEGLRRAPGHARGPRVLGGGARRQRAAGRARPAVRRARRVRPTRVVYQDACHLNHGQGVSASHASCWPASRGWSWSRSIGPACAADRPGSTT